MRPQGAAGPTCQSCGEPLLFVENRETGARLPLVRTPTRVVSIDSVRPGMVVVSKSRRKGRVLDGAAIRMNVQAILEAAADGRLHVTHFGGCSDRKGWQGTTRAERRRAGVGGRLV